MVIMAIVDNFCYEEKDKKIKDNSEQKETGYQCKQCFGKCNYPFCWENVEGEASQRS